MLRASEKQNLENDDKPQRDIKVATRTNFPNKIDTVNAETAKSEDPGPQAENAGTQHCGK